MKTKKPRPQTKGTCGSRSLKREAFLRARPWKGARASFRSSLYSWIRAICSAAVPGARFRENQAPYENRQKQKKIAIWGSRAGIRALPIVGGPPLYHTYHSLVKPFSAFNFDSAICTNLVSKIRQIAQTAKMHKKESKFALNFVYYFKKCKLCIKYIQLLVLSDYLLQWQMRLLPRKYHIQETRTYSYIQS